MLEKQGFSLKKGDTNGIRVVKEEPHGVQIGMGNLNINVCMCVLWRE